MENINEQKTDEAIARMKEMGMMPEAIQMYKHGHVLQSEGRGFLSGILYDLDEAAQKAVNVVSDNGGEPYHVIKSLTEVGTLYAVLYVSNSEEEWDMERMENFCWPFYIFDITSKMIYNVYQDILRTSHQVTISIVKHGYKWSIVLAQFLYLWIW